MKGGFRERYTVSDSQTQPIFIITKLGPTKFRIISREAENLQKHPFYKILYSFRLANFWAQILKLNTFFAVTDLRG